MSCCQEKQTESGNQPEAIAATKREMVSLCHSLAVRQLVQWWLCCSIFGEFPWPCLVADNNNGKQQLTGGQLQQQKGKMASLCHPLALGTVAALQQPFLEKPLPMPCCQDDTESNNDAARHNDIMVMLQQVNGETGTTMVQHYDSWKLHWWCNGRVTAAVRRLRCSNGDCNGAATAMVQWWRCVRWCSDNDVLAWQLQQQSNGKMLVTVLMMVTQQMMWQQQQCGDNTNRWNNQPAFKQYEY